MDQRALSMIIPPSGARLYPVKNRASTGAGHHGDLSGESSHPDIH